MIPNLMDLIKKITKKTLKYLGYKIVHAKKNNISDQLIIGQMNILLEDLKRKGLLCETILDVGANSSDWSRMAIHIFPDSNLHLIEPQFEMKNYLEAFCKEFKKASYSLAGAGAVKETLTLTVWDDLLGSSFLPLENEELKRKGKQRQVEIITIDSLIDSQIINTPTLIKLDIQGFELEALKGASLTFGKTEVYIIEVSLFAFEDNPKVPLIHDVINFMSEREYVIYDFPGFLRRPYDGALGQCDICFVKANGFLRDSNRWS